MNSEIKKYKLLSTIRYMGDGFFYPFFSLYLKSTGLAEAKTGFLLSIAPLFAVLMNPIYSKICKNINITKKVLSIITVLEGIFILLIGFSKNFYLLTVLTLLMAIFGSCHYGLMDSLTAVYSEEAHINYSSIRVYGSTAYILATSVGGYVCDILGCNISFIIAASLFVLSGFIYHIIQKINITSEEKKEEKVKIIEIISNKPMLFFAVFYALLMGLTTNTDYFFPLYLSSRGISSSQYGLIYAYFVVFEVVGLILLNKYGKKFNPDHLLIVASLCVVIRLFINYLYLPVLNSILFSSLRGVEYACVLHVAFKYVINIVGERKATLGIMLATFGSSIFIVISNNAFGHLIENYGYKNYYLITLIISIFVLILSIINIINHRNKKTSSI